MAESCFGRRKEKKIANRSTRRVSELNKGNVEYQPTTGATKGVLPLQSIDFQNTMPKNEGMGENDELEGSDIKKRVG